MTDLSGIRVITFLESQVAQISKVIRETFDLDEGHSMDRAKLLGADKMGYRSSHFVCMLGGKRAKVPEYSELTELYFEIQVRTVLQHAWAELAHDRSFKFTPGLPPELQRRLNLYAGMLEIVDSGFNSIAIEIDQYAELLRSKPISEILDNVLDSVSIHKFMLDFSKAHKLKIKRGRLSQDVLDELSRYGARNVSDLQRMATDDLVISRRKYQIDDNEVSFLRMMMMFEDIDKYFSAKVSWSVTFRRYVAPLFDKWGEAKVLRLLKERGIRIAEYNLQPYQDEPGEDE
jgi:putative GTP pyrophosphokinase